MATPLHYSGLENSMDCVVHGVAESDTTDATEHACMHVNAVIFSPVQFLCFVAKDPTSQTISVPIHQEDHTGRV